MGAIGFALMVGGVAYAITPAKAPKAGLGAVAKDGSVRAHAPAGRSGKVRQSGTSRQSGKGRGSANSRSCAESKSAGIAVGT